MKKGLRRVASVVADDGDVRVEITARVVSRNGLMATEVDRIVRGLGRSAADGVRNLPYTAFGPENTSVVLGRRR